MSVGRLSWGMLVSVCAAGVAIISGSLNAAAQSSDGTWRLLDRAPIDVQRAEPWVRPNFFQGAVLDVEALRAVLAQAPMEFSERGFEDPILVELPMPDGSFQLFEVVESPVMHPDLAEQFPDIKTYSGQGIDDPAATVRFDITPQGFHSQILSPEGSFYIDPYSRGETTFYAVYDKRDLRDRSLDGWTCFGPVNGIDAARLQLRDGDSTRASGTFLQTYRTAVAATGEYTGFHGGSVAAGQAAIVTAINRVTGVYEVDFAIRLQLVANNSSLVYTNGGTDPYTNNNGGAMLSQNQGNIDAIIGNANYDVGHVFSTGGGGIAGLAVVCRTGLKAQGVSGLPSPIGDAFTIDYVAHEMGHQFGGNHSFNSSCGGNRSGVNAFEPGSGSTIMSYAGVCGGDNLQAHSDAYFLNDSYDDIVAYTNGATGGCPANVSNGNSFPTVNAGADCTIPDQTPFILTATASDVDGDTLTYCWEQYNVGAAAQSSPFPDVGNNPFIRSLSPATNSSRMIPRLTNLLNNTFAVAETLPLTNRVMTFRCTVRDNRSGGGGVNFDSMTVTSVNTGTGFAVTAPNGGGSFSGTTTVTWNPAGSIGNGINCANVKIELSTDGGNTWPTVLLASTPNDGSESVTLPSITTGTARIRVFAVGNIFFDISNANFSITPPPGPQPFNLITPANGATGVSLTPTLIWTASTNATGYDVVVDTDAGFAPPNTYTTTTAAISTVIPGATLANNTQYFWRVTATNGVGSLAGAPNPASFTTVPPPFCFGDANHDGQVNFSDISTVLKNFGASYTPGSAGIGDANNDGTVNFSDISDILSVFLDVCP